MTKQFRLKRSRFGYFHLDPIPSSAYLDAFYKDTYSTQLKKGAKNNFMSKLMQPKKVAAKKREINWLEKTYFADRIYFLHKFFTLSTNSPKRLLDVGCGVGEFLGFISQFTEWDCTGIEPSKVFFEYARKRYNRILHTNLKNFAADRTNRNKYDVIVFANAMEHIPNPLETLRLLRSMLRRGGVLYIEVPNDFSLLQQLAQRFTKKKQWWISSPDHINYFNFTSLEGLFKKAKFRTLWRTTDFPMELFILMGDNYVDFPAIGLQCHERRVKLELSLPNDIRRDLYHSFAQRNLGRVCIMYARKI